MFIKEPSIEKLESDIVKHDSFRFLDDEIKKKIIFFPTIPDVISWTTDGSGS